MSPVAVLYSWFKDNEEYFVSSCGEIEFKDTGRGSACVNFDTENYLVSVAAWNHAICLDIQIMEVQSKDSTFPHTGDCKSIEEFKQHLDSFYTWFERETGKNA